MKIKNPLIASAILLAGAAPFAVCAYADAPPAGAAAQVAPDAITAKLESIRLTVDFHKASLDQVLSDLSDQSQRLDPMHRGVNFIVSPVATAAARPPVTLKLSNVPLEDVLHYICQMTGVKYATDGLVVYLLARGENPAPGTKLAPGIPANHP